MEYVSHRRLNIWLVWQHKQEEHQLDRLSEEGVHLEKPGFLFSTFRLLTRIHRLCSEQGAGFPRRACATGIAFHQQMSFVAAPPYSVYAISKAGVAQLTKALAVEWAPANVRVNALAPTLVTTPMMEDLFRGDPAGLKAWVWAGWRSRATWLTPSRFWRQRTGAVLPVDGGRLAG